MPYLMIIHNQNSNKKVFSNIYEWSPLLNTLGKKTISILTKEVINPLKVQQLIGEYIFYHHDGRDTIDIDGIQIHYNHIKQKISNSEFQDYSCLEYNEKILTNIKELIASSEDK